MQRNPSKQIQQIAIKWLDENALTETGLYRIPGGKTEVEGLIARFDSGEDVEIPKQVIICMLCKRRRARSYNRR